MKPTDVSHTRVRGAILGLALFFCTTCQASDASLRELVQRLFGQDSYILVERASQPPQLWLLGEGTQDAHLSKQEEVLRQALLDLSDSNPAVREDALLSLSDMDTVGVTDLVASALADVSADVRDTAASILENYSKD